MREFFGIGGYARTAEGYMSWQHLTFVTLLMIIMTAMAVYLGKKNRRRTVAQKNRVLIACAVIIDSLELFKIVLLCFRHSNPLHWLTTLPLFLCSIQLITIPLAAFSKGRLREAALDFICIFGIIGAVMGTYFAGNDYGVYPVLSFDNVVSGLTHSISGFASLYIMISGMASLKKRNIPVTLCILFSFCIAAYIANITIDYNYMFLMRGDGTPYDIVFNMVNGSPVAYPLAVVLLFVIYIAAFYGVYYMIKRPNEN